MIIKLDAYSTFKECDDLHIAGLRGTAKHRILSILNKLLICIRESHARISFDHDGVNLQRIPCLKTVIMHFVHKELYKMYIYNWQIL